MNVSCSIQQCQKSEFSSYQNSLGFISLQVESKKIISTTWVINLGHIILYCIKGV